MCTVPWKNGAFRDSAHKGLELLQENYINTHSYTLFNTSHSVLLHNYINTATHIVIEHFKLYI